MNYRKIRLKIGHPDWEAGYLYPPNILNTGFLFPSCKKGKKKYMLPCQTTPALPVINTPWTARDLRTLVRSQCSVSLLWWVSGWLIQGTQ